MQFVSDVLDERVGRDGPAGAAAVAWGGKSGAGCEPRTVQGLRPQRREMGWGDQQGTRERWEKGGVRCSEGKGSSSEPCPRSFHSQGGLPDQGPTGNS